MNKKHIEKEIAKQLKVKKNTIEKVLNQFVVCLIDALQKGEEVNISGVCKIFTRQRNERNFVSFQTGEKFCVPPKQIPVVKFSKKFVDNF